MKKIVIVFLLALVASQVIHAQGTTYLSSLSETPTGSDVVGSDSWVAAGIFTGNNVGGYVLNSVQLGMADSSGNPSGFTVMLYTEANNPSTIIPGTSLGTLDGSTDPATSGIYTYTDDLNIMLSPSTLYFIVLTAGTAVSNGAYIWNEGTYPPNSSGGWGDDNAVLHSSNGIGGWSTSPEDLNIVQFAINATAVPEPSSSWLVLLGSGIFMYARRAFHR